MRNGTSTAPAKCIGYVIHNTEDGPEALSCMDPCCTQQEAGAAKFRARPDVQPNGFTNAMLAAIPDDEAW